jgi:hypothetical protein
LKEWGRDTKVDLKSVERLKKGSVATGKGQIKVELIGGSSLLAQARIDNISHKEEKVLSFTGGQSNLWGKLDAQDMVIKQRASESLKIIHAFIIQGETRSILFFRGKDSAS